MPYAVVAEVQDQENKFQKLALMVSQKCRMVKLNRELILQTLRQTQLFYRFRVSVGNRYYVVCIKSKLRMTTENVQTPLL